MKLRKRGPISYYEPEEPPFDEYMYCDKCEDFVYEYCSLHGPLLVIPDDEVPAKTGLPAFVPRAALTIPRMFLHLAPSIIPGAGLGVFSTLSLPRGVRFGPYRGRLLEDVETSYCWQIYSESDKNKSTKVIDASDGDTSNWMRYVNCARHFSEQNLVAYQYQGGIYYRTIKIIPKFTELMVFYGGEFAQLLGIDLLHYNSDDYIKLHGLPINQPIPNTHIENELDTTTPFMPEYDSYENYQESNKIGTIQDFFLIPDDSSDSVNEYDYTEHENIEDTPKFNIDYVEIKNNETVPPMNKTCDICSKQFSSNSSCRRHKRLVHNIGFSDGTEYVCDTCGYKTNTFSMLIRHKKGHQPKVPCGFCGKTFSKRVLKDHILIHTAQTFHCCSYCDYKTTQSRYLRKHTKNIHIRNNKTLNTDRDSIFPNLSCLLTCDFCNKNFPDKRTLKFHILNHTTPDSISCSYCDYKTTKPRYLKRHIIRRHSENNNKSDIASIKERESKISHLTCDFCNKTFLGKRSLKYHILSHTAPNTFNCSYCDHKTTQARYLRRHIKVVHSGGPGSQINQNFKKE